MDNRVIPFCFATAGLWVLWLVMEFQARSPRPPQPTLYLCAAIIATGACAIVFGRLWGQFGRLNRGECGEIFVAERLEELRWRGFQCFHDIVRDGFNIDHVVVGPPGVFVIETKFRSGSGLIEFKNGEGIFVSGREEERDSLKQARGGARVIHDLICQDAGLDVWVKSLVVFVGDWTVKDVWRDTDVRVLTARQVAKYFDRQIQPELTRGEIQMICSHLNRTARAR